MTEPKPPDGLSGNNQSVSVSHVNERWLLVASVAVPLVALPFVAAILLPRQALGAVLIALAFLMLLLIVVARSAWIRTALAAALALIFAIVGGIIIWGPSTWLGFTPETAITMINPSPDNPGPQPGCVQVSFSGTPPAGEVYIMGNREKGNPRYFFQGQVTQDPATNNWISNIQIGQNGKRDGGHTFYILVYLISKQFADYLTNALPLNGASNWSSLVPPPGATLVGGIPVTRNHGNETCHSGP
jgi:hypothetical protein